jgi:hypothetical protein
MSPRKFHLGWFTSFVVDEWNEPLASTGGNPFAGDFYIEFCKALERACFDYFMIEDTLMVPETYGGNAEVALKSAVQVPKHDPAPHRPFPENAVTSRSPCSPRCQIVPPLGAGTDPPPQRRRSRAGANPSIKVSPFMLASYLQPAS